MNQSELDEIRAIVAELQETIQRHAVSGEPGARDSSTPMADVIRYQRVNSHLPIGWPTMPKGIVPKLLAYAKKITRRLLRWYINPIVDQQNAYNEAATQVLRRLSTRERELSSRLTQLQQTRDKWIRDLIERVGALEVQVERTQQEMATSAVRLRRLEHWRRREASPDDTSQPSKSPSDVSAGIDSSIDYFLLGALYRNAEQMAGFLEDYDDIFVQLARDQEDGKGPLGPVLDIGCGRGEFVAHLNEIGLSAYGIDMDVDAVEMGQAAQRRVSHEEAFAHLSGLADDSLAAVTLIQVIEHFEVPDLIRLFRLVYRKLHRDGFVLAETINPTCLLALSNWYLLDPSHRTPLHPQMTKFLLEQAEFEQVTVRFLHPVPESARLTTLPSVEGSPDLNPVIDRLNDNFNRLNGFLYGDQDYAAIAHKASEASPRMGQERPEDS